MTKQNVFLVSLVLFFVGIGLGYTYANMMIVKEVTEQALAIPTQNDMQHAEHMMPETASHMEQMMRDMNAALAGKKGDAFDKVFIDEMIVHHEGAVEMAKQALLSSDRKEIRDLATAIIEAQNKEIEDMQSWKVKWFSENQ